MSILHFFLKYIYVVFDEIRIDWMDSVCKLQAFEVYKLSIDYI